MKELYGHRSYNSRNEVLKLLLVKVYLDGLFCCKVRIRLRIR